MDACAYICLIFLSLSCLLASNQMLMSAETSADVTYSTKIDVSNCTTSREVPGACVDRAHCNYNTSNIDLTMYASLRYHSPCSNGEVCCPLPYVLPVTVSTSTDLDDDDDDM